MVDFLEDDLLSRDFWKDRKDRKLFRSPISVSASEAAGNVLSDSESVIRRFPLSKSLLDDEIRFFRELCGVFVRDFDLRREKLRFEKFLRTAKEVS